MSQTISRGTRRTSTLDTAVPPRLSSLPAEDKLVLIVSAKKNLSPERTHQVEIVWPWPQRTQHESPLADVAPGTAPPTSSDVTRRYQRDTHIVAMTAEPVKPSAYSTRRVALLLTPGNRFRFPLQPRNHSDVADSTGGPGGHQQSPEPHPVYWQAPYKPAPGAPTAAPPSFAELVVGEVYAIGLATRRRREQHSRRAPQGCFPRVLSRVVVADGASAGHANASPSSDVDAASLSSTAASSAKTPVYTHWMRSTPYRAVFSQTWADTVFVSLPCEERLLTVRVPSRLDRAALDPSCNMFVGPFLHETPWSASLSLPRGVVPLELAEIADRHAIAVGTYEHGVLLCSVSESTASLDSILRTITLAGHGSALHPVSQLAVLSPPHPAAPTLAPTAHRTVPFFAWASKAASLAAPVDSALLVSSPYALSPILMKLSDNRSGHGRQEDFPIQSALGPVQATGVYPLVQGDTVGRLVIADASRLVLLTQLCVARNEGLTGVAGHVAPSVRHHVVYRHPHLLVRLADSPATYYETYYSSRKRPSASYTPSYTRHFIVAVDGKNELLLLDRRPQNYALASSCQLKPTTLPARSTGPVALPYSTTAMATEKTQRRSPATSPSLKRPRAVDSHVHEKEADVPSTSAAAVPFGLVEPDDLTRLCSGLAVVSVGSTWLCVAAAHDQRFISLITWEAP